MAVYYYQSLISHGLKKPESERNGGAVWKIFSVLDSYNAKNSTNNTKNKLVPRFTETKDKYWDNLYGHHYLKTLTLVGFDRLSSTVTLPKKVLPLLTEWDSKVQYEVEGKILSQPRDWSSLSTGGDEDGVVGEEENGGDDNELASLADIESQVSNPYVLNSSSSPNRTNSFDTTTHSSISSTLPTSTSSSALTTSKKSRIQV